MTKQELIDKHGLEWYEDFKKRMNEYCKKKCRDDSGYHERKLKRNSAWYYALKEDTEYKDYNNERNKRYRRNTRWKQRKYVIDGRIDLIENYRLAEADSFEGWTIHHRKEIGLDGKVSYTQKQLIDKGLYYDRPPDELIWLTNSEHKKLHNSAVFWMYK
jgi:hypothetical protein